MAKVVRFYVTVLSNFARGYDKYARVFSKALIPESTYPNQFFLIRREELTIGIEKANRLLNRILLPGNQLIVLETLAEESELMDDHATGLGQYVGSSAIDLHSLHLLSHEGDTWALNPIGIEEASALSLQVLCTTFLPYSQLKPRSFSILPIARGCQANCPFCFSEASASAVQEQSKLELSQVATFAKAARWRGAGRFVITGDGEPGLVQHSQLVDLIRTGSSELGRSILITNGNHLTKLSEDQRVSYLSDYGDAGLNVLAVSRHHYDDAKNAQLMSLSTPAERIADTWHQGRSRWPELRLRFTCVLQRGGIDGLNRLEKYIDWATALGVTEICFKELYVSTSIESVYHNHSANLWSCEHQIPLSIVLAWTRQQAWEETSRLPWGAPVFNGSWRGRPIQIVAYTEPSLLWERSHGIARSWNLMADGHCLVSLEDRGSELRLAEAA